MPHLVGVDAAFARSYPEIIEQLLKVDIKAARCWRPLHAVLRRRARWGLLRLELLVGSSPKIAGEKPAPVTATIKARFRPKRPASDPKIAEPSGRMGSMMATAA